MYKKSDRRLMANVFSSLKWCSFSTLIVLLFSSAAVSQTNDKNALPEIGIVASEAVTLSKEKIIGDAYMRQLRGQAPIVQDPLLKQYIQDLGNRMVIHADNTNFPFTFFIINNNAINAFAFFGGHIGMHTGLIAKADNESEVASVIAHEIAHVTQRHIARRIQAQEKTSPLTLASLIGGILLAIANPQAGIAAVQASQAAAMQFGINYTRSNEQEADRIGISLLSRAGFDPRGAETFFQKMAAASRLVSKPPERLLTHPLSENRIADARARLNSLPRKNVPPSLSFHLAKTRVLARYTFNESYSLDYFEDAIKSNNGPFVEAPLYGYALALLRNGKADKAREIVFQLLDKRPENHFYLDLATDVYIALGDYQEAIDMLSPHYQRNPRNAVLSLNLANVYIESGNPERGIEILRDYLLTNKEDILAYQLLSDAYLAHESKGLMHQSKAEVYALVGGYQRAVDELQFAYNYADEDHLTKQRIRARIRQFRDEIEKLKAL
jgi:predicted Zn-dependent protease